MWRPQKDIIIIIFLLLVHVQTHTEEMPEQNQL